MSDIKALIVIYNKSLRDSNTFNSIKDVQGVDMIVADNSTEEFGNEAAALQAGCTYISMNGNQGLSKTYNRVISTLEKDCGVICLFDDDAHVGSNYFSALEKALKEHADIDIFAPVVKDRIGMLSPCIINGVSVKRAADLQQIPEKGISVINSGLAIRLKVFADYRYDEGQFLDYVDHAFIRDVAGHDKSKVFIMNEVVIEQRFSGSEKASRSADKERFSILRKDTGYFCRKYGISSFSGKKLLLKRRLSLLIKYLH